MRWGQAMANLSDLFAPPAAASAVPGWIAALAPGGGFRAKNLPRSEPTPDPVEPSVQPDAHELALAAAYERGLADARAAAEQQRAAETAAREGLALAFARLDAEALLALRQRLADTVAALCAEVIEPALIDRAALAERCTALASQLGESARTCALHLHPDDVPLLAPATAEAWSIRPDPDLPRGTLRLEGPDGVLADGPDEWRRLIAGALGA